MISFEQFTQQQLNEVAAISDFADLYLLEILPDSDDHRAQYIKETLFQKAKTKIQEEIEFMIITEFSGLAVSSPDEKLQKIGMTIIEMFYEMPDHMKALREGTYKLTFDDLNRKLQSEEDMPHIDYEFIERHFYFYEIDKDGKPIWATVTEIAKEMNEAEKFNNYIYLFDRFVDLVHRSGTMLGHFYAQKKPRGALKAFLDFKQNTQRIDKLLKYVSPALKRAIKYIQDWYNIFSPSKNPNLNEKILLQQFKEKLENAKNAKELAHIIKYGQYRLSSEQLDSALEEYITSSQREDMVEKAIQIFMDQEDSNNE